MSLVCSSLNTVGFKTASSHPVLKGTKQIYDELKDRPEVENKMKENPFTIEKMNVLKIYQEDVNNVDIDIDGDGKTEMMRTLLQQAETAERKLLVQMNKVILHNKAKEGRKKSACQPVYLLQSHQKELMEVDKLAWDLVRACQDFLQAYAANASRYEAKKEEKRKKKFTEQNKRQVCVLKKCSNYVQAWNGTSMLPVNEQKINLLHVYKPY